MGAAESLGGPYMTSAEAADYLGRSVSTLSNWRTKGVGPSFIRIGRGVRYSKAGLDAWLREEGKDRSGSDTASDAESEAETDATADDLPLPWHVDRSDLEALVYACLDYQDDGPVNPDLEIDEAGMTEEDYDDERHPYTQWGTLATSDWSADELSDLWRLMDSVQEARRVRSLRGLDPEFVMARVADRAEDLAEDAYGPIGPDGEPYLPGQWYDRGPSVDGRVRLVWDVDKSGDDERD